MIDLRRLLRAAGTLPAALLLPAALAGAGPPPRDAATRDFDQVHLVLRVTPRIAEGTVDGEATLSFLSLADPLKTLRLHCEETEVLSARDGEGRPLPFRVEKGILSLDLAAPLPRDGAGSVTVAYRSRPTQGIFFHAPTAENPSTPLSMYSQGEGTDNRRWFPCYDEPDDRLTCEIFATVGSDLRTVSNGTLVESLPAGEGLRTDHWRMEQRMPSYLVSLIAGRYETATAAWEGIPLEYSAPPGRAAEMATGCDGTPAMMAFFTEYTGRKYPYPRYAQTTVWDFVYGGMENSSCTTMNMRLLHGKEVRPNYTGDGLVAHELAHQWFGDLLTCRTWDHLWLNEGFATYFTDLFFEHRDGAAEFALHRRGQNRGYMDGTPLPAGLGLSPAPRGDVPLELFGGKQYDRGAAILHQLRLELGDDAFREGIRRYVRENEDRAVVSDDFRRSMEGAAGRDLSWFFDQWVYGAGYPVVEVSWEKVGDGHQVRVVVEQVQAEGGGQSGAFRFSLPVAVGGPSEPGDTWETSITLSVAARRQEFLVPWGPGPSSNIPSSLLPSPAWLRAGLGGGVFARIKVQQGFEAWSTLLRECDDPTGRLDAVEALGEWPDRAAAALEAAAKGDACWSVRVEAVRALGRNPGPGSPAALVAACADRDSRVRAAAAETLGSLPRETAAETLLALVKSDANPYVRSSAAQSLGKVHAAGAFEALSALLEEDSHRETLRYGALKGLSALGDPRALGLARPLLAYDWPRGDHQGMREAALEVLLAFEPDAPETGAAIRRLVDDPNHRMRQHACRVAGDFTARAAVEALRARAAKDPFPSVKRAAAEALKRIEGEGKKRDE